jgi:lipid-A-disaccharide synthase
MGPLLETASSLLREYADLKFVVVSLPGSADLVRKEVGPGRPEITITSEYGYEALKFSDLAIACSGTATLEGALLGTPMIVIYKLALFSWAVGRLIVKVPYVSLANLIAGEEVVPEFLQNGVDPKRLAREAGLLLTDRERRSRMIEQLNSVREKLGAGGASMKAAREALSLIS